MQRTKPLGWTLTEAYVINRWPWLVETAVEYLAWLDLRGKDVFEWGCGGSTLFFHDLGANVLSIEHNPRWADRVRRELSGNRSLVVIIPAEAPKRADPLGVSSIEPKRSFGNYVRKGFGVMRKVGRPPAIVLVDGRARPGCLRLAVKLIEPGGALVLDNSDRKAYAEAIRETDDALALRGKVCRLDMVGCGKYSKRKTWQTTIWRVT